MKITLLCALGMSTSLLVKKMNQAASARGLDVEVEAYAIDTLETQLKTADILLIGPQIRYKKNEIFPKAEAAGVPIEIIDMKAYGTINGEKVLDQALELKKRGSD